MHPRCSGDIQLRYNFPTLRKAFSWPRICLQLGLFYQIHLQQNSLKKWCLNLPSSFLLILFFLEPTWSVFCSDFTPVKSLVVSTLPNPGLSYLPSAHWTAAETDRMYKSLLEYSLHWLPGPYIPLGLVSQWSPLFSLLCWFFWIPRSLSMRVPFDDCSVHPQALICDLSQSRSFKYHLYADNFQIDSPSLDLSPDPTTYLTSPLGCLICISDLIHSKRKLIFPQ